MQYFDFTVAPNKVAPISCQGQRFYYSAGSAGGLDATIKVRFGTSGQSIILRPGQGVRAPTGTAISDTAYIENYAGQAAIVGMVFIGDDDIIDNRMTGSVEVVDGGKARTLLGNAFTAHGYAGANAGFYSGTQLWNPPGSGKNIIIEQVAPSIVGGSAVQFLMANAIITGQFVGATASKKSGGAVPAAVMYQSVTSAAALAPAATFAINAVTKLTEPYVITPGYGLIMASPLINNGVGVDVEFFEESV